LHLSFVFVSENFSLLVPTSFNKFGGPPRRPDARELGFGILVVLSDFLGFWSKLQFKGRRGCFSTRTFSR
jgi:hypothetical protein